MGGGAKGQKQQSERTGQERPDAIMFLDKENGLVVCDSCSAIIDEDITREEYSEVYGGLDICPRCRKRIAKEEHELL